MQTTILGTANPLPQLERGGTSIALSIDDDRLLIDCGPKAVYGLISAGIDITAVQDVFITHHHTDHIAGFPHFAMVSWFFGRDALTVYGPEGIDRFIEGFTHGFEAAIDAWLRHGYPDSDEGIADIDVRPISESLSVPGRDWQVSAMPVEHSLPTWAYRFDESSTGRSLVFASDTVKVTGLVDFASNADILIYPSNARGPDEPLLPIAEIPDRYLQPPFDVYHQRLSEADTRSMLGGIHSTPAEAAEIARDAAVETLVLTHFNPYRDLEAVRTQAASIFDGDVIIAEDGLTIDRQ